MTEERAQCLLCRVGPERLAVRVTDVHKVVGAARLCRLPRLPRAVAGITQHRGRIVTVFDARDLLFGESAKDYEPTRAMDARVVVLERMQRHLAIAVDAVDEIESLRLGPDLPPGPSPALRVAEHRGQAVFAVDGDRLLEMMLGSTGEAASTPRAGNFTPGRGSV